MYLYLHSIWQTSFSDARVCFSDNSSAVRLSDQWKWTNCYIIIHRNWLVQEQNMTNITYCLLGYLHQNPSTNWAFEAYSDKYTCFQIQVHGHSDEQCTEEILWKITFQLNKWTFRNTFISTCTCMYKISN